MGIYEAGKKMLCGDYSQYTPTGASYFKKAGRWEKIPSLGAIQYNYLKSTGRISHVGVVVDFSVDYQKRTFTAVTIEGNTSAASWDRNGGQVAKKTYKDIPFDSVGNGKENHIEGYGIPLFSSETCGVQDFIKALKGELGYIEKESNSSLGDPYNQATEEEKTKNKGLNNYTKYGSWYGMNGVAWCQQFVSWCAWYACKLYSERINTKWIHKDNDWYYYLNGEPIKNSWRLINGRWYVFDGSGKMITGWFKEGSLWYFMAGDGAMCENQWVKSHEDWYYVGQDGVMATNCYIKDSKGYCFVDISGTWDGKYIEDPTTGLQVIDRSGIFEYVK